ncbi:hypothetical protein RJT34_10048 [Clitoria ternatea]|uniref:Uncharacterized protein n=1 Tax=Clitoria ternatea TaxID=43366 RepID=A0AAN9PWU6_CLITE
MNSPVDIDLNIPLYLLDDNEYQNHALGSNISASVQHVEKENGIGDKIGEAQQPEFIVAQSVEFENDSGQPQSTEEEVMHVEIHDHDLGVHQYVEDDEFCETSNPNSITFTLSISKSMVQYLTTMV